MIFPKTKAPERVHLKNDETMFLPVGKSDAPSARCVLWHVADKKCHYERKQGYPTGTQYPVGSPITLALR